MFEEGKEYKQTMLYELKKTNVENFPEYQSSVQGHDWVKIIFSFDKLASKPISLNISLHLLYIFLVI